jgi:hypothetical protein
MSRTDHRTLLWVFILLLAYVSSAAGAPIALTQANTGGAPSTNPTSFDWRYILAGAVLLVGAVWLFFRSRRNTR